MFCISVSYKQAALAIREKLAFSKETQLKILNTLRGASCIRECVLLCTCNRTEVYFCGTEESWTFVRQQLSLYSDMEEETLSLWLLQFRDFSAVRHLFYVASGMDSMVIGEDEILGQTRSAFLLAQAQGTVHYELNQRFQAALSCAKKIKTETALSRTSISVATLAANEAAKMGDSVQVLVIGATGKIGLTVVKNLLSHKNVRVIVTRRQHNQDGLISLDGSVKVVDYGERYGWMDEADCIISATTSPHYTVTAQELRQVLVHPKKRLLLDLAVPPDIEKNTTSLPGITRMDLDDFEMLAKANNALKQDSVAAAKELIAKELESLEKEIAYHRFLPQLQRVKDLLAEKEPEWLLYQLKSDLTAEQFSAVLDVLKKIGER